MVKEHKYKNEKYKSRINGIHTIQYNTWRSMKQRCNDKKLHERYPSYTDCNICEEWLDFQKFSEWFDKNYIEGYQLDKDLLFPKNKLYSPDTCCFIPQEINVSIIKPYKKRELPIGVYKHRNKYVAHMSQKGGLGYNHIKITQRDTKTSALLQISPDEKIHQIPTQ